ncbi:BMQ_0737 family morphogenetic spore coat protein [Evansella halocellulosilytica]
MLAVPPAIEPVTCEAVGTRTDRFIKELDVKLQEVTIRKTANFQITLTGIPATGGAPVTLFSEPQTICFTERFLLCAPDDIDVQCDVFDVVVDGAVCCVNGEAVVTVSLLICQSVTSETEVILEIEAAECRPREDIVLPVDFCPDIIFPPQCPTIFPAAHDDDKNDKKC